MQVWKSGLVLTRLSTFDLSFNFFTLTTSNVRQLALDLAGYRREKPCSEDLPPWKTVPDMR